MDWLVIRNDKLDCGVEMENSGCVCHVRGDRVQRRFRRKEMRRIGMGGKENTVSPAGNALPVGTK